MKRFLCFLLLLGWAWGFEREGLSLTLPTEWTAQELGSEDPGLLAVLHSPRQSLVFVRRQPSNPGSKLEDVFNQLKFNVIVKQEGRVLDKDYVTLGKQRAMRVKYWGRASTGPMKQFVRYFFLTEGQLIYVHCVCATRDAAEEADFRAIAESITYQRPVDPAPDAEPH